MVSLGAISGLGNQKKSLLINELVALGDSHHPLQIEVSKALNSLQISGLFAYWFKRALSSGNNRLKLVPAAVLSTLTCPP